MIKVVDTRLSTNHHCTLISEKANFVLGYTTMNLVCRSREATVIFYLALVSLQLGYCT